MLRIRSVSVLVATVAACASPENGPSRQTPEVLQGEPIVAHLYVGGVT